MYVVGSPVHLTANFTDSTNTPIDPTTVTLNLIDPTGTVLAPLTATKLAVGSYSYDYTPLLAGTYQWYFAGTGSNAALQSPDIFTVAAATTSNIVSLAEVKKHLNMSSTVDDDELMGHIRAATAIVNKNCGYSAPTVFTETVYGRADGYGRLTVCLSRTPILASVAPVFTSTQIGNVVPDVSTLQIDAEAGIMYLGSWFTFDGAMTVTYTAGRTSIPSTLRLAALMIVRWLWDEQRGGGTSIPGMGGDDVLTDTDGIMYPARAFLLMRETPHYAAPAIA